jgi:hypothetical protein
MNRLRMTWRDINQSQIGAMASKCIHRGTLEISDLEGLIQKLLAKNAIIYPDFPVSLDLL